MYIETEWTKNPDNITDKDKAVGTITLTGRLGETMQESAKTAYTVARRYLNEIHPENHSLLIGNIHLHVPEVIILVLTNKHIIIILLLVFQNLLLICN